MRACVAWVCLVGLGAPGVATAASGTLASVVVYPDRAVVTRALATELVAGPNEVRFDDLPPSLDPATLQASGLGISGATIVSLEVRDRELAEDRRARVSELERSILATRDALVAATDAAAAAEAESKFLTQIEAASAKQLSAELLFSDQAVAQSDGIASLLRKRIPEAQAARRLAEVEARDLTATLGALERELADVRGAAQWSRRDVIVTVNAPKASSGEIGLTYSLPGASWEPVYDVVGTPGAETLDVTLSAMVHQTTGEDWSGVALSLSTARPARGLAPPALDPFWIEPPRPVYEMYDDSAGYLDDVDAESEAPRSAAVAVRASREQAPAPAPMVVQQATVASSGAVVRFDVPGGSTVPGDGARRKLKVTTLALPVRWQHEVVPRRAAAAFVVAEAAWAGDWPLLPGRASVFSSGAYVGSTPMAAAGPGAEVRFGFGQDDAVTVTLATLAETDGVPDWLGRALLTRSYRTTVQNGRADAIAVVVRDVLPRSRDTRVRVKPLGDAPTELTDELLVKWSLAVAPAASESVEHGYQIRYPKSSPPGTLP